MYYSCIVHKPIIHSPCKVCAGLALSQVMVRIILSFIVFKN